MSFLDYYTKNLAYIRSAAAAFARDYPNIASRLEMGSNEDPFVERLLEGSAFLAAQVEEKIDASFDKSLESILNALGTKSLAPSPAVAIAQILGAVGDDFTLDPAQSFEFKTPFSPAKFTPMWRAGVVPCEVSSARYYSEESLGEICEKLEQKACAEAYKSAICINLKGDLKSGAFLDFFIDATDAENAAITKAFMVDLGAVFIRQGGAMRPLNAPKCSLCALDESLRPFAAHAREIFGLNAVAEFFSYPQIFKFMRLSAAEQVLTGGSEAELIFVFHAKNPALKSIIAPQTFALNRAPLINIFKTRATRVVSEIKNEFHLTAGADTEVYDALGLEFYNDRNERLFVARPFYATDDGVAAGEMSDYFAIFRRPHATQKRSSYAGSEAFVSVSGASWREFGDQIHQIGGDLLCTNRDLPLFLHENDSSTDGRAKLLSSPYPPRFETSKEWQKLEHIMANLSTVLWRTGDGPAALVRQMLKSYGDPYVIGAIVGLKTAPATFCFLHDNHIFYEQGWRMELTLKGLADIGQFVFARVLWEFFKDFSPINSHIEMVLCDEEAGQVARWTI